MAIFFAMILRPVAVENNEEVELLLQGENMHIKKQKNFVFVNIKQSSQKCFFAFLQSKRANVGNTLGGQYPDYISPRTQIIKEDA